MALEIIKPHFLEAEEWGFSFLRLTEKRGRIAEEVKRMRVFVSKSGLFAFFLILFSSISFADEMISGHYCYTYGDNESLKEAKETTRMLAIRNAIESYRTFITSASTVRNFQLTNDLIQIISSGYLKDLKTIEHKEEGRTICETIQATVSPQAIENIIRSEVRQRTKNIEEAGIDNNEYLKIISVKTVPLDTGRREIRALIKMLTSCAYCCPIHATFFDSEGNPIGGCRTDIVNLSKGEFREISICSLPPTVKSYKVWVKEK